MLPQSAQRNVPFAGPASAIRPTLSLKNHASVHSPRNNQLRVRSAGVLLSAFPYLLRIEKG
ncbi:hypothetical protein SEA_INKED_74 [Arthrobacter phage Inked]|nr:hypothetical protein SEA_INKED_74 [Arthrobacter phage Inked]